MATFRFYAALNDFLPPVRRQREFTCRCAQGATVKHMIEALGVPHTEVELVLVNGEPAGFDRRVQEDDRLAVYPRFESLDVTPLLWVSSQPPPVTRDRELLKWREIAHGCYVHAQKPEAQLQEIVQRLDLAARFKPFTLCLNCNALLYALDPALALPRVPPSVRELQTRFSTCEVCHRIYPGNLSWQCDICL